MAVTLGLMGQDFKGTNPRNPVDVVGYTLTSSLGIGIRGMRESLLADRGGLTSSSWPSCSVPCYLGQLQLPSKQNLEASRLSRNNASIGLALQQDGFADRVGDAVQRFGASRVGLVMGTSTSSIDRTEDAYTKLDNDGRFPAPYQQSLTHNPHAPGDFAASILNLKGPRITISAACASSAKVFATAQRWLNQGLVDACVVGGADSLCLSVIYGFHSLQLVAQDACRPFDVERTGISLGEAAGFALLERAGGDLHEVQLLGAGESCDAYHMSSAHPEGLGAKLSMKRALDAADLDLKDIDYLNLHGTGTRANDATEGKVCAELMGSKTLATATKSWTGHTLGAAGIVEAILCLDTLRTGFVAGTRNTTRVEDDFPLLTESIETSVSTALSNSFGFGGNNCTLVFGKK